MQHDLSQAGRCHPTSKQAVYRGSRKGSPILLSASYASNLGFACLHQAVLKATARTAELRNRTRSKSASILGCNCCCKAAPHTNTTNVSSVHEVSPRISVEQLHFQVRCPFQSKVTTKGMQVLLGILGQVCCTRTVLLRRSDAVVTGGRNGRLGNTRLGWGFYGVVYFTDYPRRCFA